MKIFDRRESQVRSYSRSFPALFRAARGSHLYDTAGKSYLDFLAGAGTLNYGHNNRVLKSALIDYVMRDGITHGLDLYTEAKAQFLEALEGNILKPRKLDYRVQFTGPTGTNAVEAALKLARAVTNRHNVVSFTNGFHGVSLGAVSATGNQLHRGAAGLPLHGVTHLPYAGYLGDGVDTVDVLERLTGDPSSGVDHPAAVIVETVQGEGGLNVASTTWLQRLEAYCRRHGVLLIIDDIQAGCGRTGTFFSFEAAGIQPDMVTLSKALSGFGLPLAVVLMKPEIDQWQPGAHNGTFRGNNHAFVTARAALDHYWRTDDFQLDVQRKAAIVSESLQAIADRHGDMRVKGRGLMQGLSFDQPAAAGEAARRAFARGLIIETSGPRDEVLKCLCPLVIDDGDLDRGLQIIAHSVAEALSALRTKASIRKVS